MAGVSELYRAWVEAHQTAESARHLLAAAERTDREARSKLVEAEKAFGDAALTDAGKDNWGNREGLYQIGDTVFRVTEKYGGDTERHAITVSPFPVTRLEVG